MRENTHVIFNGLNIITQVQRVFWMSLFGQPQMVDLDAVQGEHLQHLLAAGPERTASPLGHDYEIGLLCLFEQIYVIIRANRRLRVLPEVLWPL